MRISTGLWCFVFLSNALAWEMPSNYPILASHDGHHFMTTNGQQFFWQADTAWLLFDRVNMTEAEEYLDDRASKGYNMILAVALSQLG
jgi:hypothetical protein